MRAFGIDEIEVLDGDFDVHLFAVSPAPEEEWGRVLGVGHLRLRLAARDECGEVAVILVKAADLLQVVVQFLLVVSFVEEVEEWWRAKRLRELHRAHQAQVRKYRVPLEADIRSYGGPATVSKTQVGRRTDEPC